MITETATEYRAQRLRRGSQEAIAEALGLQRVTITRRENGKRRVTREAMLALLTLPVINAKPCRRNANPTNADSATAPAPRKSRGVGNGSAAGATTLSNPPSTNAARLKITRGRGGATMFTASGG
jgi:DNA-binding XRE family transcriptional regulator